MARKKSAGGGGHGAASSERWLLTYADMITLLMVFFVVMYSMSRVDAEKYKALAQALSKIFGNGSVTSESMGAMGAGVSAGPVKEITPDKLQQLGQLLATETQTESGQSTISLYYGDRGLTVSMGDLLFPPGRADLTVEGKAVLDKVAMAILESPNYISVEGFTDNQPIRSRDFQSNWELSTKRAANVVHYLVDIKRVPPNKLFLVGYGEHRPVAPNDSEEGRSMNRRVDIVILKDTPVTGRGVEIKAEKKTN